MEAAWGFNSEITTLFSLKRLIWRLSGFQSRINFQILESKNANSFNPLWHGMDMVGHFPWPFEVCSWIRGSINVRDCPTALNQGQRNWWTERANSNRSFKTRGQIMPINYYIPSPPLDFQKYCSHCSNGPACSQKTRPRDNFWFIYAKNSIEFNQASIAQLIEGLTSDLWTGVRSPAGATFFYKSKDN